MFNISIKSLDKFKDISFIYNDKVKIFHKPDGVKMRLAVKDNGFIVSYKDDIMYDGEFNYRENLTDSIANSQFKIAIDHFKTIDFSKFMQDMVFEIEFLINKPTLSSNYTNTHGMVLLAAYNYGEIEDQYGKLKTRFCDHVDQVHMNHYASLLQIDTPKLIFSGRLDEFEDSYVCDELKEIHSANPNMSLKDKLLSVPSVYGGLEEGVVIHHQKTMYKWQQAYQTDQAERFKNKQKYREDTVEQEKAYWEKVNYEALKLMLGIRNRKIPTMLAELSDMLSSYNVEVTHSKKTETQILDDIQQTTKTQLIKRMPGNNNALIVGKFRVLTKAHYSIIKKALKNNSRVVIALVSSKATEHTTYFRTKMIRSCFPFANIDIINVNRANLRTITYKSPVNINVIYCGTDRFDDYTNQMKDTLGVTVKQIERTEDDISASKVIERIDDIKYFKENVPKELAGIREDIRWLYSQKQT